MHSHGGSGGSGDTVHVGRVPRLVLLVGLGLAAFATLIGVWQLWPHGAAKINDPSASTYAAPGVTFPYASVLSVQRACTMVTVTHPGQPSSMGYEQSDACGHAEVRPEGAASAAVTIGLPPEITRSGLRAGDRVQLVKIPATTAGQPDSYTYFSTDRHVSLLWMALAFAIAVVAVARLRGLMALLALGFAGWMIVSFMLPALLAGESGTWVALAGASAIMFVILYLTHGASWRTSAALAGTLFGVAITAVLGSSAIGVARLSGVGDEAGGMLGSMVSDLSFPGILSCGLIIAGLGVLNDVTITQASAVWELRALDPHASRRRIFTGAMRIGRDHIASTIYTIAFAYAGASIIVLMLMVIYDRPALELLSSESIAEEVVRTLASGMALVLAVPVTTMIATAVASPTPEGGPRHRDEEGPQGFPWYAS